MTRPSTSPRSPRSTPGKTLVLDLLTGESTGTARFGKPSTNATVPRGKKRAGRRLHRREHAVKDYPRSSDLNNGGVPPPIRTASGGALMATG